jgi:hypothetical protein
MLPPLPMPPGEDRRPQQETARINALPHPATPAIINSRPVVPLETIPRPLCWTVAGISAVIFLIQIWNYVVS